MYSQLLNQIEKSFYEGFDNNEQFRKHGEGYVGPLGMKEEDDYFLIQKVIVGFSSDEITANVRKSVLKVFINDEKDKPISVVSLRIDTDYVDTSKISSKLKNGILEIKLPKSKQSKTVQISVD